MKSHVAIDGVIALVKELGFRARGKTLNRPGPGGIAVHVVFVQSGRRSLAGRFTIEMGVFLPSVYPLETRAKGKEVPRFPRITDCQIRARIPQFAGANDIWWPSDDPQSLADLEGTIRTVVPRFFAAWGEPSAILENWRAEHATLRTQSFSPLAVAVLLHNEGCDEEVATVLKEVCLKLEARSLFPDFFIDAASKLGLDVKV